MQSGCGHCCTPSRWAPVIFGHSPATTTPGSWKNRPGNKTATMPTNQKVGRAFKLLFVREKEQEKIGKIPHSIQNGWPLIHKQWVPPFHTRTPVLQESVNAMRFSSFLLQYRDQATDTAPLIKVQVIIRTRERERVKFVATWKASFGIVLDCTNVKQTKRQSVKQVGKTHHYWWC